jgi:hypothetical protein
MLIVGALPNGCQASYFARVESLAGLLRSGLIACHNSSLCGLARLHGTSRPAFRACYHNPLGLGTSRDTVPSSLWLAPPMLHSSGLRRAILSGRWSP